MKQVSIKQAKDQLPALVREVEAGKRVVITRNGKPVAEVVPHQPRKGGLNWQASFWELAIKVRQGKLELPAPLVRLDEKLERLGCTFCPSGARRHRCETLAADQGSVRPVAARHLSS